MNRLAMGFLAVVVLGCGDGANATKKTAADPSAVKRAAARQLLDAAMQEAGRLSKADEKAAAYLSIAGVQLKLDDAAAVRQSLKTAQAAVAGLSKPDTSSAWAPATVLYIAIAQIQAWTGDLPAANATVAKIQDGWSKAEAYGRIAVVQLEKKDVAAARQTLTLAENELDNAKSNYYSNLETIYSHIASVWAETGDMTGAKAFVAKTHDNAKFAKTMSYQCIAEAQAKAGDVAGAYQTVELAKTIVAEIHEASDRIFPDLNIRETYTNIAEIQAKAGDVAGAKTTLARLQDVVQRSTADQSEAIANLAKDSVFTSQASVCLDIAAREAKAGNLAEARRNIEAAKAAAANVNDQSMKAYACLSISESQRDIGDAAPARETIMAAKTAAAKIEFKGANDNHNNINKIYAYCAIMTAQAKAGDTAGARESLETVRSLIPRFTPEYSGYKSWAYREIAQSQAASGSLAEAKATADQIESEEDRATAYRNIVYAQAASGDAAGAVEYCARMLADLPKRCKCLTDAAMSLCTK